MASQENYKFNPDSLEYEDISKSKRKTFLRYTVTVLLFAIIISVTLFIGFSYIANSPKLRQEKRENKILTEKYEELLERKHQLDKYTEELIEKDKKIHQVVFDNKPDSSFFANDNPYDKFHNVDILPIADVNKKRLSSIITNISDNKDDYDHLLKLIDAKSDEIDNIPAIQPILNNDLKYPVYGFGTRIDPVYKTPVFHKGIDYATPEGTPVFATADGKVIFASNQRGDGKKIEINHGNDYVTIYSHLGKIKTTRGRKVKRGDMIGTVGNTGKSFIPHLHYEIRYNKKSINPVNYFFLDLTPEKYFQIQEDANRVGLSLD